MLVGGEYLKRSICVCVCRCLRLFATAWTVWTTWTRLLRPRDFPGKNTGVGCYLLFQGIFLTQGLNPSLLPLLCCQAGFQPRSYLINHWTNVRLPLLMGRVEDRSPLPEKHLRQTTPHSSEPQSLLLHPVGFLPHKQAENTFWWISFLSAVIPFL